ncbi:MAG: tRNA epoxyqueuosine(34) reductase QueG [Nitratireductor sp.]|nr:tRNA epoxyqueuosine(34) reductase QueG [Nitratireductor sp.]
MSTSTSEPGRRRGARFDKPDIVALARSLGFSECRFCEASLAEKTGARLAQFVAEGRHATMAWMEETLARRRDPRSMWPQARTAIVLAMNYGPWGDPLRTLSHKDRATVSVYARHRDYHDIVKGRLKQIAQKIASANGFEVKVFVDTAPLMEKPLGEKAGLGWQGKHTNLVSRSLGSWFFIGTILTDGELEADAAETDHCGNCRACLDICPTDAFPAPYQLDARRCISYLTIEHEGPIPRPLRALMGNRIYGCDDCLAVCPWNKFARVASEAKLVAREELDAPPLAELAGLDDAAFRQFFSGSPIKRIGRDRFIRNVLIAIGNSGDPALAPHAAALLDNPAPVVRGAAVWALARLLGREAFDALAGTSLPDETDAQVREEWRAAMEAA